MPSSEKQISFLKYNNYANRVTHPGDTFNDIFGAYNPITNTYANEIARISKPTLWNPNDGITAITVTPNNTDFSTEPDYCVVWYTLSNQIESRWFVIETVRLHGGLDGKGQWQCVLRRDVFAEAWDELMDAKCNIHRAIVTKYNTLIFNKEPITVNQILYSETPIKDQTGCPWIVFYGDSAFGAQDSFDVTPNIQYDYAVNNLSEITGSADPLSIVGTKMFLYPDDFSIGMAMKNSSDITFAVPCYPYYYRTGHLDEVPLSFAGATVVTTTPKPTSVTADFTGYDTDTVYNAACDWLDLPSDSVQAVFNDLYVNQKVIYDRNTMKYYKITGFSTGTQPSPTPLLLSSAPDAFKTAFNNTFNLDFLTTTPAVSWPWIFLDSFVLQYRPTAFQVILTQVSVPGSVTVRIPNGYLPNDNPYSIWCMPYGDIDVMFNGTLYTTSKELNKNIATAISRKFSRNKIWDVQILPFCPIPDDYFVNGRITTNDTLLTKDDTIVDSNNDPKGFIFCVPQSSFETTIMLDTPITVSDPKVSDTCDVYRLCSPNYGSIFEFSAARNDGITGFTVRCTYMPIQPYIRVAPIWGGLYGDEMFKYDTRGLIMGGDYSIARIDDKWVQYQENNKNYAAIFDRQIQNMDVLRGIQREQEAWGVSAGIMQGGVSGAMAGSVAGPYGAIAGGIAGAAGAAITGSMDLKLNEKAYQENRAYTTEVFQLNLGNVQAMPRSIAKTTAFNIDNRYFPILARYTCGQSERNNVEQFIRNHSMLVDVIGTPSSYISNSWISQYGTTDRGFIQGSIININSIHDTHFVDALNEEFQKGVYTK